MSIPRPNMKRAASTLVLGGIALGITALGIAACVSYQTTARGALADGPVDVLVVFGSPADISGTPLPMQLWRVQEAVAEYRRGQAPYLLFAGGAAANAFIESDIMAQQAIQMGVPPAAILQERHSTTTLENIRGITPMLQSRGWTHAEMISSPDHLPRIGVLLRGAPFRWRLHAAPTPGRGIVPVALAYSEEALATLLLRTAGTAAEPLIHALATCEHWIVFAPRYLAYRLRSVRTRATISTQRKPSP